MQTQRAIGIDIGGGSVKSAIITFDKNMNVMQIDDLYHIHYENNIQNPINVDVPSKIIRELIKDIRRNTSNIETLGIAVTGIVDDDGIVTEGASFSDYHNYDWGAIGNAEGFYKVRVINDVRAAAYGEYRAFNKLVGTFLHVTLGTGIGSCCIIDSTSNADVVFIDSEIGFFPFIALANADIPSKSPFLIDNIKNPIALATALVGMAHVINPSHITLEGFQRSLLNPAYEFYQRNTLALSRYRNVHFNFIEDSLPHSGNLSPLSIVSKKPLLYLQKVENRLFLRMSFNDIHLENEIGYLFIYPTEKLYQSKRRRDAPTETEYIFLEEYCGAFGIEHIYLQIANTKKSFRQLSTETAKDESINSLFEHVGSLIGIGLLNSIQILKPHVLSVGGQIPSISKTIINAIVKTLNGNAVTFLPQLRIGKWGNKAGMIGAALFAIETR